MTYFQGAILRLYVIEMTKPNKDKELIEMMISLLVVILSISSLALRKLRMHSKARLMKYMMMFCLTRTLVGWF